MAFVNCSIVNNDGTRDSLGVPTFTLNSDRSAPASGTATVAAEGVLVSAEAGLVTGSVPAQPGQIYLFAAISRQGLDIVQLLGDYFYQGHNCVFPGIIRGKGEGPGRIYNVAPSSPAVATELTITVPTGAKWRFMSLNVKLIRDANAASVTHHIVIDDGTTANVIDQGNGESPAMTANNTYNLLYQPGRGVALETTFDAAKYVRLPVLSPPGGLMLTAGSRIRTVTTSIQVGDQYSVPQLWVEEWLMN